MAIECPIQVLMFYKCRLEIVKVIWSHSFVWISSVLTNSKLQSGYFERGIKLVVEGKNQKCILSSLEFFMIGTLCGFYDFIILS
jgi:hypothetical protein